MSITRRRRVILIIAVVIFAAAAAGAAIWSTVPDYSLALKANWGISLPFRALCKEVYEKDSGPSFLGDGIRCHIFSYKYEDYIDLMFAWDSTEDATLRHASYSEAAEAWLDEIDVPAGRRPDYEKCCYHYSSQDGNSEIIFFWDSDKNELYVLESFF